MSTEYLETKYKLGERMASVVEDLMDDEEEVIEVTRSFKEDLTNRARDLDLRFLALTIDTERKILYTYCLNGHLIEAYPYHYKSDNAVDEYWRTLVTIDILKKYHGNDKSLLPN